MLLRRVIGDALRARRQGQHRTLREISTAANVSLGYLSEIERGQKEASSELLAAICDALGSQLSEVLREASDSLARAETPLVDAEAPVGGEAPARVEVPAVRSEASTGAEAPARAEVPAARAEASLGAATAAAPRHRLDGDEVSVSVSVRHDGPLRTTLHAVRTRPGRRVRQHR